MNKFDKQSIMSFSKEVNHAPFENAYSKMNYIISIIMKDIMEVNPYVTNYDLYIANEALTRGECPASTLDLFLVIDGKQLELNFQEDKLYTFKTSLINFGKMFVKNFKLFNNQKKKKNKKNKSEEESELEKYTLDEKKLHSYNVNNFCVDLINELSKYFTEKTNLYLTDNCIKIAGKDDIGVFIKIYTVFKNDENNKYTLYNLNTKNKIEIDFRERYDNFDIACIRTNNMFETQIAVFNNFFYNIFKYVPNQIFIESILYSCPFALYNDNIYETTVSLINYIKNINIKNLLSICDDKELLKEKLLYKNSTEILYKFINNLALS